MRFEVTVVESLPTHGGKGTLPRRAEGIYRTDSLRLDYDAAIEAVTSSPHSWIDEVHFVRMPDNPADDAEWAKKRCRCPTMRKYRYHWLGGRMEESTGIDGHEAFTALGHGSLDCYLNSGAVGSWEEVK